VSSSNGDKQNHSQDGRYAAIYARVSTEDQGKGFSIPTQIEPGQKLAEREGYTVPETFIIIEELSIACPGGTGSNPGGRNCSRNKPACARRPTRARH
jgi:hypothetical protein